MRTLGLRRSQSPAEHWADVTRARRDECQERHQVFKALEDESPHREHDVVKKHGEAHRASPMPVSGDKRADRPRVVIPFISPCFTSFGSTNVSFGSCQAGFTAPPTSVISVGAGLVAMLFADWFNHPFWKVGRPQCRPVRVILLDQWTMYSATTVARHNRVAVSDMHLNAWSQ